MRRSIRDLHAARNGRRLLIGCALALALAGCEQPAAVQAPEPPPVRYATVTLEPADDVIRYPAIIRPRSESDLGFRIGGKVTARMVDVGDRVSPGTPLARLDPADVELQVRAVQAQLSSARADAANARADHDRYASLRQGEWTTRQEYDRRKTALDKAQARVREIEAQLHVLTNSLDYTVLEADAEGVITATLIEPGQVVAQGQTAVRIARLNDLEAVANIPEQQVASLPKRQLAVELWADPGQPMQADLREVSPSADPSTRTYQARVSLHNPPASAQIGMTATLITRLQRGGLVARLPLTALTQKDGKPALWVVGAEPVTRAGSNGDGKPQHDLWRLERRAVTVLTFIEDTAIISDGLTTGDRVVTAGTHKLDEGQAIRLWTEPRP